MNPWISIWTKTRETIDHIKNSYWVEGQGLLPFYFFGINGAAESEILELIDFDPGFQSNLISVVLILVFGIGSGYIFRFVWLNFIFFFGKIWKGQATKRNIDSVLSLSLIPEGFKFIYISGVIIVNNGNPIGLQINYALTLICFFLSIRILLVGLSRVQRFSYGTALLNIFLPQLILILLIVSIRGLY